MTLRWNAKLQRIIAAPRSSESRVQQHCVSCTSVPSGERAACQRLRMHNNVRVPSGRSHCRAINPNGNEPRRARRVTSRLVDCEIRRFHRQNIPPVPSVSRPNKYYANVIYISFIRIYDTEIMEYLFILTMFSILDIESGIRNCKHR